MIGKVVSHFTIQEELGEGGKDSNPNCLFQVGMKII
jgi:hypothetical protein